MQPRHRFLNGLLLTLAVLAVLGHICVLPTHSHAAAPAPGQSSESHDGAPTDEAVHAASCEAVTSGTPSLTPVAVVTGQVSPHDVVVGPAHKTFHLPKQLNTESPPLFLLHAALLI